MGERERDVATLLADRLRLVAVLSGFGAEALKLQQREGALRIERMRLEDLGDAADANLDGEVALLEAARRDLDDRVAAAERDIGTIDRLLADAGGGGGRKGR